jgi:deoxyribose-phosphate aldolase
MVDDKGIGRAALAQRSADLSSEDFARMVDHTALGPAVGRAAIERLCDEAGRYGFRTVCVAPAWVALSAERLASTAVGVCSVVGFPLGNTLPELKALEARAVVERGADEVDVVLAIGRLLEGDLGFVRDELEHVVEAAGGRAVKVILETALLDGEHIDLACEIAVAAGAAYVKTSTGFGPSGATEDAVRRMRARVGGRAGVKASGGIRSADLAAAMVRAGADRLGTSASVAVFEALAARRTSAGS